MNFDPQAIELIAAALAPLAVSLVKQVGWPSSVNGFIALAFYAVVGVAAVIAKGEPLTVATIVPDITLFSTVGTVAYNAFWQHTGLETTITAKTSIVGPPTVDTFDAPQSGDPPPA